MNAALALVVRIAEREERDGRERGEEEKRETRRESDRLGDWKFTKPGKFRVKFKFRRGYYESHTLVPVEP